jgi:hypothetical protein
MPNIRKTTISRKSLSLFALLFVIILTSLIITIRGHSYEVELFKSGNGWGYDILKNKMIYIHQPYIPAVPGQIPFSDKKSARKAGLLVVKKIRKHQSPALTREEIESILRNNTEVHRDFTERH